MNARKNYIDNIRWITVCIVIVYHIIYIFNCSGVISNIDVQGIPQLDTLLAFVYPWFMCLLFIIAGMSARFALQKRTAKEFIRERTKKILIPSIVGIFAYGWISGFITDRYVDMFAQSAAPVPGLIRYIIYSMMGIGPLWFAHVLFVASVLLLLVRLLDKKDKFRTLCGKTNYIALALLTVLVWASSLILNTPFITVYRFGIYLTMFFMGYFIFSHDEVIEKLKKIAIPMGIAATVMGIIYAAAYYGENYADNAVLMKPFTNLYLWTAVLAILGLGASFLNFKNKFTEYMTVNNFSFYLLHYSVVVFLGYITVTYLNLPFAINYLLILAGTIIILPLITELLKRIPIIRSLVLGIYKNKTEHKNKRKQ